MITHTKTTKIKSTADALVALEDGQIIWSTAGHTLIKKSFAALMYSADGVAWRYTKAKLHNTISYWYTQEATPESLKDFIECKKRTDEKAVKRKLNPTNKGKARVLRRERDELRAIRKQYMSRIRVLDECINELIKAG